MQENKRNHLKHMDLERVTEEFVAPDLVTSMEVARETLLNIPRKKDILKILEVIKFAHKQLSGRKKLRILDVGGKDGFIDKLLVNEARQQGLELEAFILDTDQSSLTVANNHYKNEGEDNMHFVCADAESIGNLFNYDFDVVINSYMSDNIDLGKYIRQVKTGARIYVKDNSQGDWGCTGTPAAYEAGEGFVRYGAWQAISHTDLSEFKYNNSMFGENYKPANIIETQLSDRLLGNATALEKSLVDIDTREIPKEQVYEWERELKGDYNFMHFQKGKVRTEDF